MGAINHKYLKLQKKLEIFLKVFSLVNSTMLDSKILTISGATIKGNFPKFSHKYLLIMHTFPFI